MFILKFNFIYLIVIKHRMKDSADTRITTYKRERNIVSMTRNKSGYRRLFINIDISRNRECIYKLNSQRVLKRNCKRGVSLSFSSRSSKSILFLASRKNFKTSCYRANKKDSIVERFRLPYANFNTRALQF